MFDARVQIIECPRDAIQGIEKVISTQKKIDYINFLIETQLFDCIDFGSFVSPKAVPQMADTAEVLEGINPNFNTKLLVIVVNEKGADRAVSFDKIDYLGYPFSISESFQLRNTRQGIEESFEVLKKINDKTIVKNKETIVYISMAFGNPYGDHWSVDTVIENISRIKTLGISRFSLADTTGEADSNLVQEVFKKVSLCFPELEIGLHLHTKKEDSLDKIKLAYEAGCRKFEGAILGFGGCPFAQDSLVGNLPSEDLLREFRNLDESLILDIQSNFKRLINI